jgi:serine/threonine-protein kinase
VAIQHINGGAAMPSTLNPNIPGGLEQIIMHAMAHEPESRYNSATKMLKDMDEFRKDPGILFDYNIPPLDEVIRINKPPLILNPEPATTAQKVEKKKTGTETPRRRTPESGKSHAARQREAEEERRSNAATVAIIACSAVMVIAIVVFLVVLFSGANAKTQLVDVPNLVGEVYEELPSYPDFRVKLDKKVHDDTYPAGQIIDQNPVAGTQIEKNNTIYVTVSLGEVPQIVKMPNVVDWELSQAERALNNLEMNLHIKIEKIHHDEIAKGSVVRSEPEAETELIAGQEVTLYVSEGVEFKTGLMPDVVGDDKQSAIQVLKSQELDLQIVEEPVYDSVVEVGEVVRTDPEAGEELTTGQKITLYISKGPQLVELQNVVGLSVDKAVSILKGDGFENCKIEPMESDKPKDTVIELRAEDKVLNAGDELDINTKIIIYYSIGNGQETGVTKDVVINIGNATESGPCEVVVTRDGVEVFHETVPKGQTTITIPNQTGTGKVIYLVCTDDLDDWPYTEDFS